MHEQIVFISGCQMLLGCFVQLERSAVEEDLSTVFTNFRSSKLAPDLEDLDLSQKLKTLEKR